MAYCLILSLFVLVKAVADSASSIILLTSGTEVERSLFRRFFFLPQTSSSPLLEPIFRAPTFTSTADSHHRAILPSLHTRRSQACPNRHDTPTRALMAISRMPCKLR